MAAMNNLGLHIEGRAPETVWVPEREMATESPSPRAQGPLQLRFLATQLVTHRHDRARIARSYPGRRLHRIAQGAQRLQMMVV
jgi:hypothetical protein